MNYAIVYSSRTGNTRNLAETIRNTLPAGDCVYFGEPNEAALTAKRLYVGFWTDKGSCDGQTAAFLKKITDQEVFLFGTAGFGENQEYFDKVLGRTMTQMGRDARLIGSFMCQGRMPMTVRERYEKMLKSPVKIPNLQAMIDNFDRALTHPDQEDLSALSRAVGKCDSSGSCCRL